MNELFWCKPNNSNMCHDPNIDTFKNVNYFTIALLSVFLAIMADIAEEESGECEVMYCLVKISYQCGWEAISCYLRFPVNSGKVNLMEKINVSITGKPSQALFYMYFVVFIDLLTCMVINHTLSNVVSFFSQMNNILCWGNL